jgi:serine/threonine protein kinase
MVKARTIVMSCRLDEEPDSRFTSGNIFSAALNSYTDFNKWRQILMDMATEKDGGKDTDPDWLGQFKQTLHGIHTPAMDGEETESKDPGPQQLLLALEVLARNKTPAEQMPAELLPQLHFSVDQARRLMEQRDAPGFKASPAEDAVTQGMKEINHFYVNMIVASEMIFLCKNKHYCVCQWYYLRAMMHCHFGQCMEAVNDCKAAITSADVQLEEKERMLLHEQIVQLLVSNMRSPKTVRNGTKPFEQAEQVRQALNLALLIAHDAQKEDIERYIVDHTNNTWKTTLLAAKVHMDTKQWARAIAIFQAVLQFPELFPGKAHQAVISEYTRQCRQQEKKSVQNSKKKNKAGRAGSRTGTVATTSSSSRAAPTDEQLLGQEQQGGADGILDKRFHTRFLKLTAKQLDAACTVPVTEELKVLLDFIPRLVEQVEQLVLMHKTNVLAAGLVDSWEEGMKEEEGEEGEGGATSTQSWWPSFCTASMAVANGVEGPVLQEIYCYPAGVGTRGDSSNTVQNKEKGGEKQEGERGETQAAQCNLVCDGPIGELPLVLDDAASETESGGPLRFVCAFCAQAQDKRQRTATAAAAAAAAAAAVPPPLAAAVSPPLPAAAAGYTYGTSSTQQPLHLERAVWTCDGFAQEEPWWPEFETLAANTSECNEARQSKPKSRKGKQSKAPKAEQETIKLNFGICINGEMLLDEGSRSRMLYPLVAQYYALEPARESLEICVISQPMQTKATVAKAWLQNVFCDIVGASSQKHPTEIKMVGAMASLQRQLVIQLQCARHLQYSLIARSVVQSVVKGMKEEEEELAKQEADGKRAELQAELLEEEDEEKGKHSKKAKKKKKKKKKKQEGQEQEVAEHQQRGTEKEEKEAEQGHKQKQQEVVVEEEEKEEEEEQEEGQEEEEEKGKEEKEGEKEGEEEKEEKEEEEKEEKEEEEEVEKEEEETDDLVEEQLVKEEEEMKKADKALQLAMDEALQQAMEEGTEAGLEAAIERVKQKAQEQNFSVKKLKMMKAAKRKLKELAPPPPQQLWSKVVSAKGVATSEVVSEASPTPARTPEPASAAATTAIKTTVFKTPKTVGSLTYDLADVLGEGSCGTKVYRGRHSDGRDVAVKVMNKEEVPEHRARREMQLLQELAEGTGCGRDHVIQYRCLEAEEGKMLLGMELCECSLHDVISVQQQQIPSQQQIRIVRELSEAVAFLHEHQIVHCDVRPKNILFKQGGYEGVVKLTDFGLSKAVDTRDLNVSFSTTTMLPGTEVGSFGYYAPEHHRQGNPTPKVDIFSLGCCMFYVFCGRRPFEDPREPNNKVLMLTNIQIGRSNLKPVHHLREVFDLVASMIDIEAKKRPPTAHVLEHVLFWSDEKRFQFICAVGKEDDVASNSPVARAALPPSLLPKQAWSDAIDKRVWLHYTTGEQARTYYDTSSATHLLRFLRNCEAHPPPQDSPAQAVLAAHGSMASYFVGVEGSCFPQLVMGVMRSLMRASWNTRSSLARWFVGGFAAAPQRQQVQQQSVVLETAGAGASDILAPTAAADTRANGAFGGSTDDMYSVSGSAAVVGSVAPSEVVAPAAALATESAAASTSVMEWSENDVAAWLKGIGTAYCKYKAAFVENGINGEMLLAEDFGEEYLDELGVTSKMPRSRIMKERVKLPRT